MLRQINLGNYAQVKTPGAASAPPQKLPPPRGGQLLISPSFTDKRCPKSKVKETSNKLVHFEWRYSFTFQKNTASRGITRVPSSIHYAFNVTAGSGHDRVTALEKKIEDIGSYETCSTGNFCQQSVSTWGMIIAPTWEKAVGYDLGKGLNGLGRWAQGV